MLEMGQRDGPRGLAYHIWSASWLTWLGTTCAGCVTRCVKERYTVTFGRKLRMGSIHHNCIPMVLFLGPLMH